MWGLFHPKTVECFFCVPKHAKSFLMGDKMRRVGGGLGGCKGKFMIYFAGIKNKTKNKQESIIIF